MGIKIMAYILMCLLSDSVVPRYKPYGKLESLPVPRAALTRGLTFFLKSSLTYTERDNELMFF